MRILRFKVIGQKIYRDSSCDFRGIAAGTENYLKCDFAFSSEWSGAVKVCDFSSDKVKSSPVKIINNTCMIPSEVLTEKEFRFYIAGKRGDLKLTTDQATVQQEVQK